MTYPTELVTQSREQLSRLGQDQFAAFNEDQSVQFLLFERSDLVDRILSSFWAYYLNEQDQTLQALIATGGYGRRELHPGSDIDIMVLLQENVSETSQQCIADFLTVLWDIGLEVGYSVRTLEETVQASKNDITIATSLQESRCLVGSQELFTSMLNATGPTNIWPSDQFFQAKFEEQQQRHQRYRGTAYNLEPNIKGNIGGLRDLQVVSWVLKRHFDASSFTELVEKNFLSPQEHIELNQARDFLWKVRFALHVLSGKREDRLLFDNQIRVAELLGYSGNDSEKPVEEFMRDYYRTSMSLNRLNEMLLQMFREVIIEKEKTAIVHQLSNSFQSKNDYLDIKHDEVFRKDPSQLLKLFGIWQNTASLRGISARTIRGITENLEHIDDKYRLDPSNQKTFLAIFEKPQRIFNTLLRMNRVGVLGKFFPGFGRIVGHMQFDLFHAYTVDAHILFVIKELQDLLIDIHDNDLINQALSGIDSIQTLLLSGFFHDIAKGRGGDHSTLGAQDVLNFGRSFNLEDGQINLLAWLVENHLILSVTAQKKDIDDPAVIRDFAKKIPNTRYLHYLYLLTIADVRGTNPKLWNNWKATLFARLYQSTVKFFAKESLGASHLATENRIAAFNMLCNEFSEETVEQAWSIIDDEYFLRHRSDEIVWHTREILHRKKLPVVLIRDHSDHLNNNTQRLQSLDIFIAAEYEPELFSQIATALTELNLDIYSAKLFRNQRPIRRQIVTAITFRVRETRMDILFDQERIKQIDDHLQSVLQGKHTPELFANISKQARLFKIPTRIRFDTDPSNTYTTLEVVTADRPGLLALISSCIAEVEADINLAKIMTIGEKAEDVFYISNSEKTKLNAEQQELLRSKISTTLES